jgi:hypothetical protein
MVDTSLYQNSWKTNIRALCSKLACTHVSLCFAAPLIAFAVIMKTTPEDSLPIQEYIQYVFGNESTTVMSLLHQITSSFIQEVMYYFL